MLAHGIQIGCMRNKYVCNSLLCCKVSGLSKANFFYFVFVRNENEKRRIESSIFKENLQFKFCEDFAG